MKYLRFLVAALVIGYLVLHLQLGHWAMLGALVLMIVAHEFGHWIVARLFGFEAKTFSIGFGSKPRIVLGHLWGTEFQATPWLVGGYVSLDPSDNGFRAKAAWKRALVLVAGVTMNVVLAFVLMSALYATQGKANPQPAGLSVQAVVSDSSPAARAGIARGDEIVSVDGDNVVSFEQFVTDVRKHNDGTAATIVVRRNSQLLTIAVTPDANGRIGAAIDQHFNMNYQRLNPLAATIESGKTVFAMGSQMVTGLLMMLHIMPTPTGVPVGAGDVHGVVGIIQMGQTALSNGLYSFITLVCLVSMNLAFLNILPIPVLDGGHLLFLAWEKVSGKPIRSEVQGALTVIFFGLLLLLMFFGLFNDITHPL
jgi:regulator of sigma E protease